jgi:hypothetical protein
MQVRLLCNPEGVEHAFLISPYNYENFTNKKTVSLSEDGS